MKDDDKFYSLLNKIMNNQVDELTAVQTLDSILADQVKPIDLNKYIRSEREYKARLETGAVQMLKRAGRVESIIELLQLPKKNWSSKRSERK